MDGIIIVALVSLQLVSFFFIVILFAKLSKFKDLERKQEQIVEEMDAALGAYLMEMKEENDRLIQQLASIPKLEKGTSANLQVGPKAQAVVQSVPKFVSTTAATSVYKTNIEKQNQIEESAMLTPNSTVVEGKNNEDSIASDAGQASIPQEQLQVKELSFEEMVVEMYKDGQSIEAIAKSLDKGKTEIELLIKFHT